ncbi:MAG TPA: ChbG/HpnK family deacetylase [Thermoanaerobaculia bacterium]
MKRLIVTADDVGLDRGMTEGAICAHRDGIVTACSIVANGREFDDAVARLRDVPTLEVGVHLTMVEERSLVSGQLMPKNWRRFIFAKHDLIADELRAQIEKVLATGLRVTHMNGHQHLHLFPRVFQLAQHLAHQYRIPYLRTVDDHGGSAGPFRRLSIAALNFFGRRATGGNDRTIGVLEAGHLTNIERLLDHVEGVTELVTHPGVNVDGYPHWRYEWDAETRALCDPALRDAIARRGIELIAPSQLNVGAGFSRHTAG